MACPNVRRENLVVFGKPRFYYLEHDQSTDDPLQEKMRRTALAGGLLTLLGSTAHCVLGQEHDESQLPPGAKLVDQSKPSVINSTYTIVDRFGNETLTLHEEGETLVLDREGKPSVSVEYAKVKRIPVPILPFCYIFGESNVPIATLPMRSDTEARAVAEYIARRAGLELVVDVWRVRKPFQCPEPAPIGCLDFRELLDHNDPEIVGYFYHLDQANLQTFACFSSDEQRFFTLQYYVPYLQSSESRFFHKVFRNGQENSSTLVHLRWRGDVGEITDSLQRTGKRQTLGWIDSSSLSFHDKFTNKQGSTTDYTLDIRWSTGRYSESYSWRDDKGKTAVTDSSGICVKLN
jgi:hypothetical protein